MSPVSCSLELVQVLNFFLLFRSLTTYSRFFPVQLESQAGVLISSLLMPATADQPHLACIRCTDRLFRRTMQTLFSGSIADKRHMSFCVVGNFSSPRPFTQRTSSKYFQRNVLARRPSLFSVLISGSSTLSF